MARNASTPNATPDPAPAAEENSTAMTPASPTQPATMGQMGLGGLEAFSEFKSQGVPIVGMEDLSAEDIKMPKIKLCQPTSAEVTDEKAKQGQFYNVTTSEAYDELECQLLSFGKSRVKWPEVFKRGDEPLCRSLDNEVSDTTGELCKDCPDRVWNDGQRPACGQVYVFLGLLPNGSPFRMMFSGAQISGTKNFLTEIGRNNLPAFIYKMKLTSEKQKNEKGTYYITNFEFAKNPDGSYVTIASKNPDPEKAAAETRAAYTYYKDMTESLKAIFNKVRETDLVSTDSADNSADGKGIF